MAEPKRLVEDQFGLADDHGKFFVVEDMHGLVTAPDRFLLCRRHRIGGATVVAHFAEFDYAHFCARRLAEYDPEGTEEDEDTNV